MYVLRRDLPTCQREHGDSQRRAGPTWHPLHHRYGEIFRSRTADTSLISSDNFFFGAAATAPATAPAAAAAGFAGGFGGGFAGAGAGGFGII